MALVQAFRESEHDPSHLNDPFDWTVDQVVYSLCSPNSPILQWTGGVFIPDPEGFERVLREEQINGETLLTTVTMDILRNDLGIKALGARSKIFNLIGQLQHQSFKYQRTLEKNAVRDSRLSSVVPMSRYQTPHLTSPLFTALKLTYDQPERRVQSGETPLSPSSLLSAADAAPVVDTTSMTCQAAGNEDKSPPVEVTNQPQESSFLDGNGRRRRRLAPTMVTEASSSIRPPVSTDVANEEPLQEPQISVEYNHKGVSQAEDQPPRLFPADEVLNKIISEDQPTNEVLSFDPVSTITPNKEDDVDLRRRKRVMPTRVEKTGKDHSCEPSNDSTISADHEQAAELLQNIHISKESALGKRSKRAIHQIYYGASASQVDEIFYSDIALGEVATDGARNLTTEQQELSFNSMRQLSDAQRLWVNSRMKYFFLRSMDSHLNVKKDRREVGIVPYPDRLGKKHRPLSMTVLTQTREGITRLRANRLNWTMKASPTKASNVFDVSDPSMVVACNDGNWDALEKWNSIYGDKVLPKYGDSDSEDDYVSETYAEMEAENREMNKNAGPSRTPKLTTAEVEAAIDDGIRQLREEWQIKQCPKIQHKAWRVWTKARRDHTTELQIAHFVQRITELDGRILNLRVEIGKEEWFKVNQIMLQSKSMQPSIFEREENQWKLSILKSESAPQKLPAPARKVRETKTSTVPFEQNEEETILAQSSADDEETDDDLDDFIVDDDLDGSETQAVPENEDVNMAYNEDVGLSDTLANSPTTNARKRKEQSHPKLPSATIEHAESAQKQMADLIDLTQASDSLDSPPPKKILTRLATPPILKEDEDSDAWFAHARSVKPEFKHPPKIEDIPIVYLDDGSDSETVIRATMPPTVKLPPFSDVDGIIKLDPTKLVEKQDRKRLLIWLVAITSPPKRFWILQFVNRIVMEDCLEQIKRGLRVIRSGRLSIPRTDRATSDGILQLAVWYVGWTIPVKMDSKGVNVDHINTTLENDEGFDTFHEFLLECLKHYKRSFSITGTPSKRSREGNARDENLSGLPSEAQSTPSKRSKKGKARDEDLSDFSVVTKTTPRERSKKAEAEDEDVSDSSALADLQNPVPESQEALQKRGVALRRMHEDSQRVQQRAQRDARRKELMPRLDAIAASQTEAFEVILNPGKLDDHDLIRLNPQFGRGAHLKPHQKEGLQFMWREITGDHKDLQGCLLAQTMGLGKTIQVIALLVAISDAVHSPNQRIRNQVSSPPRHGLVLSLHTPMRNTNIENIPGTCRTTLLSNLSPLSSSIDRELVGRVFDVAPFVEPLRRAQKSQHLPYTRRADQRNSSLGGRGRHPVDGLPHL